LYKTGVHPPSTVRTADVAAQPWKNGGGTTRELLAQPAGADWRVRISVAEVAAAGPFSAFPGVTRWFAVLDGAGVVMTIAGGERRCTPGDESIAFAGDADTQCRPIDGPTRDLNLMLRGIDGAMARVVPAATWRPTTRACGLYASEAGECRVVERAERVDTTRRADCAARAARIAVPAHALCWWPEAPAALAFDGAGWWLGADLAPSP
jgi:uncharacterized protein